MIIRGNRKRSMKNQKGFTLMEALITISIIIIVSTIAVPQFQRMARNGNLKAAARDIMGDFANMRERAISENQNFSIVFNQAHNNYTVPGIATPKSPATIAGDTKITNITFPGGGSTLTFQTRGTILPTGTNKITLTNGLGSTATIYVLTAGRIYVQYALN
jgi:prepilin-type N-terminal cleavage/methylation domain-containing protein